jgi:zinc transport system permease protein
MAAFIDALRNPSILFVRYALIAGLLGSVSFGIIGSYVVARRISYIAGAIAHSSLGGIGAGLYVQAKFGVSWFTPIVGAIIAALISGILISYVSLYARQREDTVIGAIWAIGMTTGLLFITRTPGNVDPMSYLFGNILLIRRVDLIIIAILDCVIIILSVLFYHRFLAVSFDEEFARVRGVRVGLFYLLLICLTALTVVLMVTVVGIVMVIALLTLPAAVAGLFSKQLWQMMIFASLICMLFTVLGLWFSYVYDLPSGANIIMVAGALYLVSVIGARLLKRWKRYGREVPLRQEDADAETE